MADRGILGHSGAKGTNIWNLSHSGAKAAYIRILGHFGAKGTNIWNLGKNREKRRVFRQNREVDCSTLAKQREKDEKRC